MGYPWVMDEAQTRQESLLGETSQTWVSVAVARPFPEPLTYAIPTWLMGRLEVGHVVLVPLGRTSETGYVVGFPAEPGFDPSKVWDWLRAGGSDPDALSRLRNDWTHRVAGDLRLSVQDDS